jgi:antitoxin component YwqK of YwqJK toxin-antitoxin module
MNGLSYKFDVLDSDEKGVKNYDNSKCYFWYKSQKILTTQGGSSGNLLHGEYLSYYTNSQLCEQGQFKRGLKNGKWSYWNSNGTLIKQEKWKNGLQKGEQLVFDSLGKLQKNLTFGLFRNEVSTVDSILIYSGRKSELILMDSTGKKTAVQRKKNQLLHGKQISYASDGTKLITRYKNGELVTKKSDSAQEINSETTKKKFDWNRLNPFKKKKTEKEKEPKAVKEKKKLQLFKKKEKV